MLSVSVHIDGMPEAEAINLINGFPSQRIIYLARKALIRARDEAITNGALTFETRADGAIDVRDGVEIMGTARHYKRYWQIYLRLDQGNIRRSTWPLLKLAIEERYRDRKVK